MNIKKSITVSVTSLVCAGLLSGIGTTASGAQCSTPMVPQTGSLALPFTDARVSVSCSGDGTAAMESIGTGAGGPVSANLILGVEASVAGYNRDRQIIGTCFARDTSPNKGPTTSAGSCVGAVFKDLVVFN